MRFIADLGLRVAPNPHFTYLSPTLVSDIIDSISKPIEQEL